MATVVKATEHVLVETATAVAATVTKAATSEFKTLESGIAHEAVSAADDNVSNLLDKVEGAAEVVIEEVVKGVGEVVETVKQHPELIAEGALAVAVGVASLVQPELIAGEVAILGKMAADSAKKTVTKIASDEGEKIVKAISKDLADDAKAEAEKDKLQAEEKAKQDGTDDAKKDEEGETGAKDCEPATAKSDKIGAKSIAIELQKEPAVKAEDGSKEVENEKETAPVELKITIGADGEIKAVSKSVPEGAKTEEKKTEEEKPVGKSDIPAVSEPKTGASSPVKEVSSVPATLEAPLHATDSKPVEAKETPKTVVQDTTVLPKPDDEGSESKELPAPIVKEISIHITQEQPISAPASVEKVEAPIKKEVAAVEQETVKEPAKPELSPDPTEAVKSEEVKIPELKVTPVEKTAEALTAIKAVPSENSTPVKEEVVETPKPASILEATLAVQPISVGEAVAEPVTPTSVPETSNVEISIDSSPEIQAPEPKKDPEPSVSAPAPVESTIVEQAEEVSSAPSSIPVGLIETPREQTPEPEVIKQDVVEELDQSPVLDEMVVPTESDETAPAEPQVAKKDLITLIEESPKPSTVLAKSDDGISITSTPKPLAGSITSEPVLETSPLLDSTPSTVELKDTLQDEPIPAGLTSKPLETTMSQAKDLAVSALEQPSSAENDSIQVAVASVTNTIKTTSTSTFVEQPSSPSVPMVTVTQESLDHLHSKLDAMHEAIQLITKTLAAHLPPSTETPKQNAIEGISTVVSEPIPEASVPQEPETPAQQIQSTAEDDAITPIPSDTPAPEQPQASPESQTTEAPTATPKRPTHVKRKSVILTIGSYLWPFGGSASKTADVKANTVEISADEIEVDSAKKDAAPGSELSKAVSTVSVSDVVAPAVAAV